MDNKDRNNTNASDLSSQKKTGRVENDSIVPVPSSGKGNKNNYAPVSSRANKKASSQTKKDKSDQYEDINSYTKPGKNFFARKVKPFFMKNNKKNLKAVIVTVLSILGVCLVTVTALYGPSLFRIMRSVFNDIRIDTSEDANMGEKDAKFTDVEDENLAELDKMYELDAGSLNETLKAWATNGGKKMSSKNVINCLLIGVDSMDVTRSDTMIIASVNLKEKKITLFSIMRDCYTYTIIDGQGRYGKINAACCWGGPSTLVETIENNLKIEIDNYVLVDFSSFPKLINSVGGIDVEITEREANFINRTTRYTVSSGKSVHLDGDKALVFSRIRKLDGDDQRTRRQRLVIMALINKVKSSSVTDLDDFIETMMPNIRTNYSKKQILSYGTRAISGGWANFKIEQYLSPLVEAEDNQTVTGKSAKIRIPDYYDGYQFVWIVDYPLEAVRLQKALYGTTNIILQEDRNSVFDQMYENTTTSYNYNNYTQYGTTSYQTTAQTIYTQWDTTTSATTEDTTQDTTNGYTHWWETTAPTTESDPTTENSTTAADPTTEATTAPTEATQSTRGGLFGR